MAGSVRSRAPAASALLGQPRTARMSRRRSSGRSPSPGAARPPPYKAAAAAGRGAWGHPTGCPEEALHTPRSTEHLSGELAPCRDPSNCPGLSPGADLKPGGPLDLSPELCLLGTGSPAPPSRFPIAPLPQASCKGRSVPCHGMRDSSTVPAWDRRSPPSSRVCPTSPVTPDSEGQATLSRGRALWCESGLEYWLISACSVSPPFRVFVSL